jgi:hypothetical protein
MDHSLPDLWQTTPAAPFLPTVGKGSQFLVGFVLVLLGLFLSVTFALNRSLVNIPLVGLPASTALAFGTVYMFCAVGVYV